MRAAASKGPVMPIDPTRMSESSMMGKLINVGLNLARKVGLGLGLVNELRDAEPDVDLKTIGQAASAIGQGINAANLARSGNPDDLLNLDNMPVVPPTFFTGNEASRVMAMADVTFETTDPADPESPADSRTWDVRSECSEATTFQELIDCIESHFEQFLDESPQLDIQPIVNRFVHVFFLGKRF